MLRFAKISILRGKGTSDIQCPHLLRETNFKENNAISHLTDDNIILNPLLPSDTLDQ